MAIPREELAAQLTTALIAQLKPIDALQIEVVSKQIAEAYATIYQTVRAAGLARSQEDFSNLSS